MRLQTILSLGVLVASAAAATGACQAPGPADEGGDGDTSSGFGEIDGSLILGADGRPVEGSDPFSSTESPRTRCESTETIAADLRRLTALEFEATINDIFPEVAATWGGVSLGADPVGPLGFTNNSQKLVVGPQTAEEIYRTAGDLGEALTAEGVIQTLLPCAEFADRGCANYFIDTYGERMYRRGVSDIERDELLNYFDSVAVRSDFATGIKWMITAMVQSPFFVYRSEIGFDGGQLTAEEIATQLSYIYTGKSPSPELLARARAGEFASPEARVAEARNMVAADPNHSILMRFFNEWSGYKQVESAVKFGLEDNINALRASMVKETEAFFREVVINLGGNVPSLLNANYTFTDGVLAQHYGFGEAGDDVQKSIRPEGQGLGLLAQGSLLSTMSGPDITSPIFRGLFVFEKLLCNEEAVLPEGVIPPIEAAAEANTTRERFEIQHAQPGCNSCHREFEPFGFGMEDFDEAGRFRTFETNEEQGVDYAINAAAAAPLPDDSTLEFNGSTDLSTKLSQLPVITDCVSGLLASFAYSGGGGQVCVAETERTALQDGVYGLYEYYIQLAASPNMTQRLY
jgi:hypothetical protein